MTTEIKFPSDIVEENADELTDEIVEKALAILDVWDPSAYGKAPTGVAATATYVAADSLSVNRTEYTQEDLCEVFDSSPMTIRKHRSEAVKTARENDVI